MLYISRSLLTFFLFVKESILKFEIIFQNLNEKYKIEHIHGNILFSAEIKQ